MAPFEVERKYRMAHAPFRPMLDRAGFTYDSTIEQHDRYLDHPLRHFGVTDEALRIRTVDGEDSTHEVTYKGPQRGTTAKTRRELTVGIDGADALESVFIAIDFELVATVTKTRERYERDGISVVLDEVEGLGEFVEIEVLTDEAGIEAAEGRLDALASELGLDDAELVDRTYLGLLLSD